MSSLKQNYLRLGLLNARSINTGKEELFVTLLNYSPDILALNETWLKAGEEALAPVIPNYKFIHRARQVKKGGGVGFYVRQNISTRIREHPRSSLEQMWLEVHLPGTTMAIGTAYRPEYVSVQETLDALSETMNSMARCDITCILGDFNIDMACVSSSKVKELKHFCYHHSLQQLVKEPTRITDHSQTIIDLVMTDSPLKCKNIDVIHNHCLSDHALVIVDLDIKKPKLNKEVRFQRPLYYINQDKFTEDLKLIPWESIYTLHNVDEMVKTFNMYVIKLFDIHAPIRKVVLKDKPKPWITNMVKFMMKLRDKALTKAQKDKKDSSKDYYRNLRNFVTATIERERKAYYNNFVNKNIKNPTLLWKNIKTSTQFDYMHKSIIPEDLNDPNKINDHFLNLPVSNETVVQKTFTSLIDTPELDMLVLKSTTEQEVKVIIDNIKTNAEGHDGISIGMIKLTLDVTLPIITRILNKSIETNTFPSCWKRALVRPIPKKNSPTEIKDLRPISILPVLSKVLEKVVLNQVLNYLETKDIIPKFQSGFRRGHGTETALLHVTDDLTEASDMGMSSIMVLLDYSRAFDCLETELLLHKLSCYGFSKNTCLWFRSFLANREQMVETDDKYGEKKRSCLRSVQRGVPQGSLLSPVLFTIFTADLPRHIKFCKYHLYADDTQLYYSFHSKDAREAIEKVNDDLRSIHTWSENNSLVLNAAKSQMLVLGTKRQIKNVLDVGEKVKINNVILEQVTSARNLGLILDGEQKFIDHVNNKIRTAFFKLKTLYKIRPYLKEDLRILLCDTLVLSQFNYCSSTFGPRLKFNTERAIQRVQNACVRFCFNVPKREYITPYLNKKCLLNMSARRELQYACTVHRVIWNKKPEYLFEKLLWIKDISHRNLRTNSLNMLSMPKHKTTRYRGCFKFVAARIWNDLPPPMRNKMSTDSFKAKYKSALLKRQIAAENLKHTYWKYINLRDFF